MMTRHRNKVVAGLLAFYLIVRFFFTSQLDALGTYASYYFEGVLVSICLYLYSDQKNRWLATPRSLAALAPLSFIGGFAIFKLAGLLGIAIPFDLRSHQLILFLIVIAPVLEEV